MEVPLCVHVSIAEQPLTFVLPDAVPAKKKLGWFIKNSVSTAVRLLRIVVYQFCDAALVATNIYKKMDQSASTAVLRSRPWEKLLLSVVARVPGKHEQRSIFALIAEHRLTAHAPIVAVPVFSRLNTRRLGAEHQNANGAAAIPGVQKQGFVETAIKRMLQESATALTAEKSLATAPVFDAVPAMGKHDEYFKEMFDECLKMDTPNSIGQGIHGLISEAPSTSTSLWQRRCSDDLSPLMNRSTTSTANVPTIDRKTFSSWTRTITENIIEVCRRSACSQVSAPTASG